MASSRRRRNPIDRCVADVDRQMGALEKKLREAEIEVAAREALGSAAQSSPSAAVSTFVKEMLKPVARKAAAPTYKPRYDLFDTTAEPLKDLEGTPNAFAPAGQPDLFTSIPTTAPDDPEAKGGKVATDATKLVHYLAPGSIKSYRPPLKHVQRQTRNRFLMWMGLSCAALWVIYVVVR